MRGSSVVYSKPWQMNLPRSLNGLGGPAGTPGRRSFFKGQPTLWRRPRAPLPSPRHVVSTQEVCARGGVDQRRAQALAAAHRDVGTQRAIDGTLVPWQASGAENPQLRRLAPAPIFVVRSVLWP